eukprot:TRINITY_DN59299_c0_g1_i1.p1 TRINITY_DN59299_c0_g1~~TRINITY_DN59299_c0_g1_i1.p1  ORF type:complete len:627 (+),score=109.55 TRINITY_DN59299_c0_g1_i1:58-1938(+)
MDPAHVEVRSSELLWQTNDSVHGTIGIPAFLKNIIDTEIFQRMREIKQTGLLEYVYFGATHTRFVHSVGTCFLAHKLLKKLQQDRPDKVQSKDILCICMAALMHDLGHPAFSHMFEVFMRESGRPGTAKWSHEDASKKLVEELFKQLDGKLRAQGLTDRDLLFVTELIDPPKKQLIQALKENKLREQWPLKGRDFKDAWMYEIVSNWRSGMDVDRFDYFVRDATHCGLTPGFDHERYLTNVKLTFYNPMDANADESNPENIWTLASQQKDADYLKRSFFEQRREYHRLAYQHKTLKKMEMHMVCILQKMAPRLYVENGKGESKPLYEAADLRDGVFDWTAYVKITDEFVRTKLKEMTDLYAEYKFCILERNLARNCAEFENEESDWPRPEDEAEFLKAICDECFSERIKRICPVGDDFTVGDLGDSHLRIVRTTLHEGSGESNPMEHMLLLDGKNPEPEKRKVLAGDMKDSWSRVIEQLGVEHEPIISKIKRNMYCQRKIHVFWNPPLVTDPTTQSLQRKFSASVEHSIVQRVCMATRLCVDVLSARPSCLAEPESPQACRLRRKSGGKLDIYNKEVSSPTGMKRTNDSSTQAGTKKRRQLQVHSSCPPLPTQLAEVERLRAASND